MEAVKDSFDFIFNTIPTDKVFKQFFGCLQRGGIFVQVGQPEFSEGTLAFNCFEIIGKECTLV